MIAEATLRFCSTQAMASWAIVSPTPSATGCNRCTPLRYSSVIQRWIMSAPPLSSVARVPSGGACPGSYLPLSTPWATGDQTICETPSSSLAGTTSASMTRQSIEYCGWLETSWTPRSSASA